MIIVTTTREKKNALATIASSGIDNIVKPRTIANAAPRAAPEATPSVNGETNGLPKHPCINAPATARAMPPTIAVRILGNLQSQIIAFWIFVPSRSIPCKRDRSSQEDDDIQAVKLYHKLSATVSILRKNFFVSEITIFQLVTMSRLDDEPRPNAKTADNKVKTASPKIIKS